MRVSCSTKPYFTLPVIVISKLVVTQPFPHNLLGHITHFAILSTDAKTIFIARVEVKVGSGGVRVTWVGTQPQNFKEPSRDFVAIPDEIL